MSSLLKYKFATIGVLISAILVGIGYIAMRAKAPPESNDIIDELISITPQSKFRVIHAKKPEKGLLLFITDTKKTDTTNYAKQFAELSYYVAIIDNQDLLNSGTNSENQCLNLAKKLTELSVQLNTQFTLNNEDLPILVGIENGAASVYSALAQAEKKTFHAAIGINFTPQLTAHTQLCEQEKFTVNSNGENSASLGFKSLNRLPASFYIFQDKKLPTNTVTREFANNISNAKFTIAKEET